VRKMCEMLDLALYKVTLVFRWLRRTKSLSLSLLQNHCYPKYVRRFASGTYAVGPSYFSLVWKNTCMSFITTSHTTLVGGTLFEDSATHWPTQGKE